MRKQQILDFVRRFPGRDDDEISRLLKIQPRQAVNQACRKLEASGQIIRKSGTNGQISNYPTPHEGALAVPIGDKVNPKLNHPTGKPPLPVGVLLAAGFTKAADWTLGEGEILRASMAIPKGPGVYAFAKDGFVLYVGLATMGLEKRLYFYAKPGVSQRTSQRLNGQLKEELNASSKVEILVATPDDLEWNGLPVHGAAGLEMGIIKKYALPWNMRGAA